MASGVLAYAMLQGWPEMMPGILRACFAVFIVIVALSWWAFGGKSEQLPEAEGSRKPGWLDYGAVGLGLLALECGFLWVFSISQEPLENVAVLVEQRFRPESAKERNDVEGDLVVGGNWLWQSEQRRPLPRRTNLKPGAKPEVFIRLARKKDADDLLQDQVYVRAFALDRYQDGVWSSYSEKTERIDAGNDGWVRFGNARGGEILHEVFHGNDGRGEDVFIALQGATAVRLPSLQNSGNGTYVLPESTDEDGYEYLASSRPLLLKNLKESEMVPAKDKSKLSNPEIKDLAIQAAGEGTALEKIANIEAFLREGYGYSLVTRNSRNLDPLENFLFYEKRGHCEFFATAAALMIRELGFESRVAYGWAGGQYFEGNNSFVFRAREAHSWVEIHIEDYGWVLIEPTPPTALGENGRSSRADADTEFPGSEEIIEELDELEAAGSDSIASVFLGVAGVSAIGALLFVLLRERTQFEFKGQRTQDSKQTRSYFAVWKRALAERGIPFRGRTMRMHLEELERRPDFSDEMTAYHYGVAYEGKISELDREKRIEKKIRDWQSDG
ncbi:MAG: transglutaminase family protein [Akkermansiaceae bacterium]